MADLDAIGRQADHAQLIRAIAGLGLAVWLDAGIAEAADAARAVTQGASRVIVGTETLRDPGDLVGIVAAATGACALSLDLRHGQLLGGSPAVEQLEPLTLAAMAWEAGVRSFIVLDLARVGSGEGARLDTARALRRQLPAAELIVGGGVRDRADLVTLRDGGFQGALVATALHTGVITSLTLEPSGPPRGPVHRPPPPGAPGGAPPREPAVPGSSSCARCHPPSVVGSPGARPPISARSSASVPPRSA